MSGPFNYDRMQKTATRLLTRFGKQTPMLLKEPGATTGPSYNPTEGAPAEHKVIGVVLNYSKHDIGDGTRIQATDKRVMLAYAALVNPPSDAWLLNFKAVGDTAAKDYRIVQIDPLEPGDVLLLWDVQVRAK